MIRLGCLGDLLIKVPGGILTEVILSYFILRYFEAARRTVSYAFCFFITVSSRKNLLKTLRYEYMLDLFRI